MGFCVNHTLCQTYRQHRQGSDVIVRSLTHYPAASVGGHVAVNLHTLAEVSVDVDGVDSAQGLSIQEVLRTVLRRGKQSVSWGGKGLRNIQNNTAKESEGSLGG